MKSFNHSAHATDPAYVALVHAMIDVLNSDIPGSRADVVSLMQEAAAAVIYGDMCATCKISGENVMTLGVMEGAEVEKGWIAGRYRCPQCGERWTCGYAIGARDLD